MTEIREEIVSVILSHTDSEGIVDEYRAAEAILAIPRLQEALALLAEQQANRELSQRMDSSIRAEMKSKSLSPPISTNTRGT